MSGRIGAGLLVKVANRQYMVAGLRNYHISSNVVPTYMRKTKLNLDTPARSLQLISWNGSTFNESRAWSPLVRNMSTAPSVHRNYQISSNVVPTYMRKTKLNLDTPARSLHLISWNGGTFNESRAWSPLVRNMSTAPSVHRVNVAQNATSEDNNEATSNQKAPKSINAVQMEKSNYWGVAPKVHLKEDGTPWNWHCFSPHEAYAPDVTIDLTKHHKPENWTDSIAFWTVKSLRLPTDLFFRKRYGCRAMMLETVAAVPGMVGGMLLHFKSLRRFETSGGWIKALLEEAENERMHLMTFMEVAKPAWYERALVITVQGIFFNAYFLLYLMSPKLAHRITGYLEEEAIYSYTMFLNEIDKGNISNGPAPPIAIDYWRLPKDATIRDVVMVVRADEAHHRDVNHFAAKNSISTSPVQYQYCGEDIHKQGKQLRELPAPVGYH